MRGILAIVAVVLSVALTGCVDGGSTTADESPAPTSTRSNPPPTPTPTPTPTSTTGSESPTGPPPLDELVITPGGLDQLALSSAPGLSSVVELELLECGSEEPVEAWRSIYPAQGDRGDLLPFYVALAPDGLVGGIQVFSPAIATAQGVRTGSTRDELLAAYPGITIAASDYRHDVYTVEGRDGRLELSVAHAREEASWDPAQFETVTQILAARVEYPVYLPTFHPLGASCM
jgi:glucose/arabinose dehydrogenase